MGEEKKEKIKYTKQYSYNPDPGEDFYLITDDKQMETIKEYLLASIKQFKRTVSPNTGEVTGNHYHVEIKIPGKSLQKALKGSRYLYDRKFSGSMSMDEYNKHQAMYDDFQGAPSRLIEDTIKPLHNKKIYSSFWGQLFYTKKQRDTIIKILTIINNTFINNIFLGLTLSRYWENTLVFNYKFYTDGIYNIHMKGLHKLWKKNNLEQNKIGLLGRLKDELYKTKEDLLSDLKETGFTEEEIKVINATIVFNIDREPYIDKKVSLEDPQNGFMWLGNLHNSACKEKIKVESGKFGNKSGHNIEISNIKDCIWMSLAEYNFYIFEDVIERIFDKYKKFYISITFTKYEDKLTQVKPGEYTQPLYTWNMNKLWEITKV